MGDEKEPLVMFKGNKKKSIIDEFISDYVVADGRKWHVAECVHALSVDEQLELFRKKLLSLLKFAYKHDLRIGLCRTKREQKPYDFTEFSIDVPNKYTNVLTFDDQGNVDDDPLVEILFTIQKVNGSAYLQTVNEFGESMIRCACAEIWVSYSLDGWASVGIESDAGETAAIKYETSKSNTVTIDDGMVLDTDICDALEKMFQDVVNTIKSDKKWYSWFILQYVDIDEVFLWKLS